MSFLRLRKPVLHAILAVGIGLGASVATFDMAVASPHAETFYVGGGTPARALVAGPEHARVGVLVVHDYFGFTDFTREVVERLGAQGYRALAIDLYGGRSATTHEEAVQLMQALAAQDRAVTDGTLQAGLDALKRPGRKLVTLGFSMGGIEALKAALNDPQPVNATAIVYGFGFDQIDAQRLAQLHGPLFTITGGRDEGSVQSSANLLKRAGELPQPYQAVVLPGLAHAYAQPLFDGGKGYSVEGTRTTWELLDDFLARHVPLHRGKPER